MKREDLIKQRKDENIKKINFISVTLIIVFNINLFTESFFYNRCCKNSGYFFGCNFKKFI